MRTMIIAAAASFILGTAAASAAGVPVGFQGPDSGTQAFSDHSKDAQVEFLGRGTVLGKMFHRAPDRNPVAENTVTKG